MISGVTRKSNAAHNKLKLDKLSSHQGKSKNFIVNKPKTEI